MSPAAMSRNEIHGLIARAKAEPPPALATIPDDELLAYLLDTSQVWWRRETIARFWACTLPPRFAGALVDLVTNPRDTTEVRVAVLRALCPMITGPERDRLLDWLRTRPEEQTYGLSEALMAARGRLADLSAARELTLLARDPWSHRAMLGHDGLRDLQRLVGDEALLGEFGHADYDAMAREATEAADRLYAIRRLDEQGAELTPFLSDPDTTVARHVFDVTRERALDLAQLRKQATGAPTVQSRCWALLALLRQGEDIGDLVQGDDDLRVPLPRVPEDVRRAIVHHYAPGERDSDPRWLLERERTEPPAWEPRDDDEDLTPEVSAALERLTAAIKAQGLEPEPPVSSGESYGQGGGTYLAIEIEAQRATALLSTLGPFVSGWGDPELLAKLEAAAHEAELRWIDDEIAATKPAGLCVYFFGKREPLRVQDLLFYWQD